YTSYFFFFSWYGDHRDLHSFPTRRSSDLVRAAGPHRGGPATAAGPARPDRLRPLVYRWHLHPGQPGGRRRLVKKKVAGEPADHRSEEHTSELQSQSNLVCRLLLEKKKNHK